MANGFESTMSKPRRARRRDPDDEDRDFGDTTPYKNMSALYGFRLGVIGLVPVLGLILGPLAIVFSAIAIYRYRRDNSVGGYSQSHAGLVLGLLDTTCNAIGIYLIARGMSWI